MRFLEDLAAQGRVDTRVFATARQWTNGVMQAARPSDSAP
jgi:hypothetical protein